VWRVVRGTYTIGNRLQAEEHVVREHVTHGRVNDGREVRLEVAVRLARQRSVGIARPQLRQAAMEWIEGELDGAAARHGMDATRRTVAEWLGW